MGGRRRKRAREGRCQRARRKAKSFAGEGRKSQDKRGECFYSDEREEERVSDLESLLNLLELARRLSSGSSSFVPPSSYFLARPSRGLIYTSPQPGAHALSLVSTWALNLKERSSD